MRTPTVSKTIILSETLVIRILAHPPYTILTRHLSRTKETRKQNEAAPSGQPHCDVKARRTMPDSGFQDMFQRRIRIVQRFGHFRVGDFPGHDIHPVLKPGMLLQRLDQTQIGDM